MNAQEVIRRLVQEWRLPQIQVSVDPNWLKAKGKKAAFIPSERVMVLRSSEISSAEEMESLMHELMHISGLRHPGDTFNGALGEPTASLLLAELKLHEKLTHDYYEFHVKNLQYLGVRLQAGATTDAQALELLLKNLEANLHVCYLRSITIDTSQFNAGDKVSKLNLAASPLIRDSYHSGKAKTFTWLRPHRWREQDPLVLVWQNGAAVAKDVYLDLELLMPEGTMT